MKINMVYSFRLYFPKLLLNDLIVSVPALFIRALD